MRNQIREVLSAKKRFFIIIPILMIIIVLPFSFVISYYINIQKYTHLNADGYSITDTFDVEEFKDFLAEDSLYKIKKHYSHFNQVWKDRYYIMTDQPVSIDKAYGEQFAYGYGTVDSEKLSSSYVMVNAVKVFTLRLCISAYYIHFKRVKVKIFTAFTIIVVK